MHLRLLVGLLACAIPISSSSAAKTSPIDWRFRELRFRVPVTVHSGLYARENCLVRWAMESGALLQGAGIAGPLATNSFRLVAEDSPSEIALLFVPKVDGPDELRWLMPGKSDVLSARRFWVYFDACATPDPAIRTGRAFSAAGMIALLPDEPTNLVRNPGFEIAEPGQPGMPAGWLAQNLRDSEGRLELVDNPRHAGRRALKLEGLSGEQFGVQQDHIPLKPNTLYRLGVWGRAEAANTNELVCLQLLALLRNAEGTSVGLQRASIDAAQAVSSDGWVHLQKRGLMPYHSQVRTPPDTAFCNLRIYLWSDASKEISISGIAYIDDVELVEVRPQDLVPAVSAEGGKVEQWSQAGL
jgi:hypothetical protein